MEGNIQNYDYSFICHLYDALGNIHVMQDYPPETLHSILILEQVCELHKDHQRSELTKMNGTYEFFTPLDSADVLMDGVFALYNECPNPSCCPGLDALMNIACEREQVRNEHKDIPYPH